MRKVRLLKIFHPGFAVLPLLFLAQPAVAQRADAGQANSGARRLTIADFQQYAPINALDIVSRIPGFSINGGDGRRGFGDNAGNVLIDGDRPSTKTDDIFTLLTRIPAAQVDYIELTESAGGDGEARGKAQIVNVVRKKSIKPSGTYEGGVTLGEHGGIAPYAKGSVSLRRGLTTIDLNGGYSSDDTRGGGPEDFFDGRRSLIERRTYDGHGGYKEGNLGAAIKTRSGSTKINANSKLIWNDGFDDRLGPITGPTGLAIGLEDLRTKTPISNFAYEIGGDVEFPLAKKLTTKLIALWGQEPQSNLTNVTTSSVVRPTNSFTALSHERASEGIFRVQNDWAGIKNHAVQFGAEIAFNRLRSDLTQSSGTGGAITPLPASNVTVAEWRVEPFVSDVWSLSPTWKLEAGLVYEASWLTLSGDSRGKRSLQFLRPRLIGTWTISKQTTLELRAEREVSQLNFSDFATSVDLSQGNRVDVGNANLVPEQTSALSALIRQKFMDRGSIQLKAEYEFIKDTQDRIPITLRDTAGNITNRFDAVGNIGDSKRWNFELEMTLPFDWITNGLGIKGMEVKYTGHYHGSQVTDPVTGLSRRMSGRPEWHQNWAFRHDLTNAGISWGFTAYKQAPSTIYFFDQTSQVRGKTDLSLFVEYKKLKIGTVQLQVFDATSHLWERDRFFFRDTRASGDINRIIERDRRLDRRVQLSLSGKF
jgi:hypothetical protein